MEKNVAQSKFFMKIFPIFSFFFGPILISIGIFIPNIIWKIIFIVAGSSLIIGLYLSRRINSMSSHDLCPACNGSGSIKDQSNQLSEHSVKNCLSYRGATRTCGLCEGTGKRKMKESA